MCDDVVGCPRAGRCWGLGCFGLFYFALREGYVNSFLLSEVERVLNSGVFCRLYHTCTWTITHVQGTACVATSCGVGGTPVPGESAWSQESQEIFVFCELNLLLNGSPRLSCGPNHSLSLHSLTGISGREKRLEGPAVRKRNAGFLLKTGA